MEYNRNPEGIVEKIRALMEWGELEIIPEDKKEDGTFARYTILYTATGDESFEFGEISSPVLEKALDDCIALYNNRILIGRGIITSNDTPGDLSNTYSINSSPKR